MKVKELIEELQKCNPDAKVEGRSLAREEDEQTICSDEEYEGHVVEIKSGNPASSAVPVVIISE